MKKFYTLLFLIIFGVGAYCQEEPTADMTTTVQEPLIYIGSIGLDGGINYEGIVALSAEVNVVKNFCVNGAVGMDFWGSKLTIGGRFYSSYPKGVFYGASFSHSSGVKGAKLNLETTTSGTSTEKIELNLKPVSNLNLAIGYQWKLGNRFRIHMDIGYAVALEPEPWEVVTPGKELTKISEQILNFYAPGGLMLGLGFSVGL